MTPNKANKVLKMFLHKQCDLKRTEFAYDETEVWLAVFTAKNALENQIPKKPIVYKVYDTGKVVGYVCPKCKCDEIYSGIYRYDYCRDCGQAIDWSEEE